MTGLHNAGQLWHAAPPVDASVHQLLRLHIIGHLPLEVHPPLQVAGACKVLGAAGYEADCQAAPKQGQRALLPEAVYEGDGPAVTLHSLSQRPVFGSSLVKLACWLQKRCPFQAAVLHSRAQGVVSCTNQLGITSCAPPTAARYGQEQITYMTWRTPRLDQDCITKPCFVRCSTRRLGLEYQASRTLQMRYR